MAAQNNWFSRMTQNVAGALDPQSARDATLIGAYNRDVSQDEAAQQYQELYTESMVTYHTLQGHLEDGTVPDSFMGGEYLDDPAKGKAAFAAYAKNLTKNVERQGSPIHALKPSDHFTIRGAKAATDLLNAGGFGYKILGPNKWFDGSTSYGPMVGEAEEGRAFDPQFSGKNEYLGQRSVGLGMYPQVATMDQETKDIRTTAMTSRGDNMRDLSPEGLEDYVSGGEGQGQVVQGFDMNVIDSLFGRYVKDRIQVGKIQDMTRTLNMGLDTTRPSETNMRGLLSEDALTALTPQQEEILFDPNASRADKTSILEQAIADRKKPTTDPQKKEAVDKIRVDHATEDDKFKPGEGPFELSGGDGAFFIPGVNSDPGDMQPVEGLDPEGEEGASVPRLFTGEEARLAIDKIKNTIGGTGTGGVDPFTGGVGQAQEPLFSDPSQSVYNRLTPEHAEALLPGYTERTGRPLGYTEEAWDALGPERRRFATKLSAAADRRTRERDTASVRNTLKYSVGGFKGQDKSVQEEDADTLVTEFYKEHLPEVLQARGGYNKPDKMYRKYVENTDLMKRLRANPAQYEQYKDDPYKFALDIMQLDKSSRREALYGKPATKTDLQTVAGVASTKQVNAANNAIESGDRGALEKIVNDIDKPTAALEEALAAFNQQRNGDMYLLPKPHKTRHILAYMAALPKDHPMYEALLGSPTTLATFLQTGNWTLAGETLRQTIRSNDQKDRKTFLELRKEQSRLSDDAATYSSNATTAHTAFFTAIVKPSFLQAGEALQMEFGRISTALRAGATFELSPKLAADFAAVHRLQGMLVKRYVRQVTAPGWFENLYTFGFARDPDSAYLELNPGIKAFDKQSNPITSLDDLDKVHTFRETSGNREVSAFKMDGELGRQVKAHLLAAAVAQHQEEQERIRRNRSTQNQ